MVKIKNQRKRLHDVIQEQQHVQYGESSRNKIRHNVRQDDQFVDERLSRRILTQARQQGEDLERELYGASAGARSKVNRTPMRPVKLSRTAGIDSDEEETDRHLFDNFSSLEKTVMAINDEEEEDLRKFMNPSQKQRRTLADIISEKLAETKTAMSEILTDVHVEKEIDPIVREHFIKIGEVLAHYRSGKLPKGFKSIPSFPNWQQLLELTKPDNWTAASVYAATRIFVSNLPRRRFKDFCSLILLPRIRDDICEYKRLNFHLFQALHKSIYKAGDFFEGIVLPLCEAGDCTLREATIVAGVLSQSSIPVNFSSAALELISKMEYNGANSIFMRAILNKKYKIAGQTIDAVVNHFVRFLDVTDTMPVLWHQCLLTFVQRYKENLTKEQKSQILKVISYHEHHEITPEVRREIIHSNRCRGDPVVEDKEDDS